MIDLQRSERDIGNIVEAIIQQGQGRSNAVGRVTLTAGATSTVVDKSVSRAAVNVAAGSEIFLSPKTANAAASLANVYVSAVGQGTFTLSHNASAQTDRTYGFVCFG